MTTRHSWRQHGRPVPADPAASASARYSEATKGFLPVFLPAGMTSFLAISGTGVHLSFSAREGQHVVVDHLGAAAVVALAGGGLLALQGLLPDAGAVELGGDGEHREQHGLRRVGAKP